jgi:hypothetical protein
MQTYSELFSGIYFTTLTGRKKEGIEHMIIRKAEPSEYQVVREFYEAKQQSTTSIGAAAPHGCG